MAGQDNLVPVRSTEEARARGRNGGIKSGEARRRKRDLKQRMKVLMEMPADPQIKKALEKTGVEIDDNLDVVLAAIMKGVLKGDARMIDKALELMEMNPHSKANKQIQRLEKRKAELEAEKLEMENERTRLWLDSVKGISQEELPDDGFLAALNNTAEDDWSDYEDI